MRRYAPIIAFSVLAVCVCAQESSVFLTEDFDNLENWNPLLFPKIPKHSTYTIQNDGTNSILKAESNASASGLIYKKTFDVNKYPRVKWRWKTENILTEGNAKTKNGDDYPIRVYIIFRYDPSKASFGLKAKYKLAKAIYGEYPPHSSLNYIWANRKHDQTIIVSPYTSRSIMIPLQQGASNLNRWVDQETNILKDYDEAFGKKPPDKASIAIMSDTDNTGESAISYVDFITVLR